MKSIFTNDSLQTNPFADKLKNIPQENFQELQAKLAGLQSNSNDFFKLIETTEKPEQWIAFCFSIENKLSIEKIENLWQLGLDKFHKYSIYLESIGFFYFRIKKFHKALNFLKKSQEKHHSLIAIKVSIAASYSLAQYQLVWDFYNLLTDKEQTQIEDDLLSKVASSALEEEKYKEAEKIFKFIRDRNNLPQLPKLEEVLMRTFNNKDTMSTWLKDMSAKLKKKQSRSQESLYSWMTYSSVLMYLDKYEEALACLYKIKSERFE